MSEATLQRMIAPPGGRPGSVEEGLQTLAECCLAYVHAYLAGERENALLWAGAVAGLSSMLHDVAYREANHEHD